MCRVSVEWKMHRALAADAATAVSVDDRMQHMEPFRDSPVLVSEPRAVTCVSLWHSMCAWAHGRDSLPAPPRAPPSRPSAADKWTSIKSNNHSQLNLFY
ncbi:hypothetical protein EVAR_42664_1 [Eumeta japonica]|uniref:Uncharacterized protein n=1 Tax=Eumeta variegata TaxID=151549 RepID=A0A4C1YP80_EUMVA|nr:hypothetical protein EVAR_42664_1 [Eumeta japonica]